MEHPENIIFGYGDELDKSYQNILDKNDNELLRNVKSVKYLKTRHYHELLEFLMSVPFQVLIMGHSCGNSNRTLLNTDTDKCKRITESNYPLLNLRSETLNLRSKTLNAHSKSLNGGSKTLNER